MRRIALFVVVASTMAWATVVGVTGCSSSEATKNTPDASKKISSSSSSGDDNTSSSGDNGSSSSSGSTSSGGTKDGGADASTSSGGLGSNPKKVTCGAKECSPAQNCCWTDGKQDQAACGPDDNGCGATFNGFNIACDESADCATGEICCWGDGQTTCAGKDGKCADVGKPGDNPDQPDMQVCKTDAECVIGTKCALKTCKLGPAGEEISVKINVCGTPTNCN